MRKEIYDILMMKVVELDGDNISLPALLMFLKGIERNYWGVYNLIKNNTDSFPFLEAKGSLNDLIDSIEYRLRYDE